MLGRENSAQCACEESAQREHLTKVGQPREDPSFDASVIQRARDFLDRYLAASDAGAALPRTGQERPFSEAEVEAAYKRLRQCAASLDGLQKKCFAVGRPALLPVLSALFSHLMATGEAVAEWCLAVVVMIQKKGASITDLDNFRGITLSSFMKQWYSMCILVRLEVILNPHIPSVQQGFRKGGSCPSAILAVYALVEKLWLDHLPLYSAFVDLKKAFPTVQRDLLFAKLGKYGVPARMLRAIMALYEDTRGVIRTADGYGEDFPIDIGTLEGSVLSPLLFIAFIADFPDWCAAKLRLVGKEPGIGNMILWCVFFADDLALLALDPADLTHMLELWSQYCSENHQQTSVPKTKIMVHHTPDCRSVRVESGKCYVRKRLRRAGENAFSEFTFNYRGEVLEVVEVFPYLGCETHHTAGLQFAYASRDKKAGRQWGALRSALRSAPHLPASRAFVLAESLVGESELSGAECWGPFACRALGRGGVPLWSSVVGWLGGVPSRLRSSRVVGVVPVRSWKVEMAARALRWLEGSYGSALSAHAAWQLYDNYCRAPRRSRRDTWLGTLENVVASIDPRWGEFSFAHAWQGAPVLRVRCIAPRPSPCCISRGAVTLSRRLRLDADQLALRSRYHDILVKRPTDHQQEFVMHRIICMRYGLDPLLDHGGVPESSEGVSPLLGAVPDMRLHHLQKTVQFVLGIAGFARVHAHHALRERERSAPGAFHEWCRNIRACLYCYCHDGSLHLDSEWHMVFGCPLHADERRRILVGRDGDSYRHYFAAASSVEDLAACFLFSCGDARRLGRMSVMVATMLHTRCRFLSRRDLASSVLARLG